MNISLELAAREYVDTVKGPENGLGQNVHPVYGRSDYMLHRMNSVFGEKETNAAVDAIFAEKRQPTNYAAFQQRFDNGIVTLAECRRLGSTHRAYEWASNPPVQFSDSQKQAYKDGYNGKA